MFRHGVAFEYGTGGGSGPISRRSTPGFKTLDAARVEAIKELLRRFDTDWQPVAHSDQTNRDVADVVGQLKARLAQPSFLDLLT